MKKICSYNGCNWEVVYLPINYEGQPSSRGHWHHVNNNGLIVTGRLLSYTSGSNCLIEEHQPFFGELTDDNPRYDEDAVVSINAARAFCGFPPPNDEVNHPLHYNSHPSGVEAITITRHHSFNIGNAIKYLWRAGLKTKGEDTTLEAQIKDLEKAIWYIKDEIQKLQNESE